MKQVAHVDSYCNEWTNNSEIDGVLSDVFGSLTNIIPSLELDFGFLAEGQLYALDHTIADTKTWQALNYTSTMPTHCLSFDRHASTYGPASNTATATATSTAGSNGSGHPSAGVAIVNPITKMMSGMGRMELLAALLFSLSVYFVNM